MLPTIILKLLEKHPITATRRSTGLIADLAPLPGDADLRGRDRRLYPGQQDRTRRSIWRTPCSRRIRRRTTLLRRLQAGGQARCREMVTIGGPSGIGKSSIIADGAPKRCSSARCCWRWAKSTSFRRRCLRRIKAPRSAP